MVNYRTKEIDTLVKDIQKEAIKDYMRTWKPEQWALSALDKAKIEMEKAKAIRHAAEQNLRLARAEPIKKRVELAKVYKTVKWNYYVAQQAHLKAEEMVKLSYHDPLQDTELGIKMLEYLERRVL